MLVPHVCRMEYNYSPLCFPAKRVCRGRARIHRGFHENIKLYSKVRQIQKHGKYCKYPIPADK